MKIPQNFTCLLIITWRFTYQYVSIKLIKTMFDGVISLLLYSWVWIDIWEHVWSTSLQSHIVPQCSGIKAVLLR